jgi:hypothetical protein
VHLPENPVYPAEDQLHLPRRPVQPPPSPPPHPDSHSQHPASHSQHAESSPEHAETPVRPPEPADRLTDDLKTRVLHALLENDELRRERESRSRRIAQLEAERDRLAAQVRALEQDRAAHEDSPAWEELSTLEHGESVWRWLAPRLKELAFTFRTTMRLAPGTLSELIGKLAELAGVSPLAAYAPVFPPRNPEDADRLAPTLGLAAALGAYRGLPREERERLLLVTFFASFFLARPEQTGPFACQLEQRLRALPGVPAVARDEIEKWLELVRPVTRFVTLVVADGREIPDAVAALSAEDGLAGREPLRLFLSAFGVWPRGSWLRLSDGTIAYVAAHTPAGLLVIRSWAQEEGSVRFLPPTPLLVGKGTACQALGPVRFSSPKKGGKG